MTAPRKPATRASSSVAFDLDALEREQTFKPFTIKADGKVITLLDARELDWQVAANLSPERPFEFFDAVVSESDRETFFAAKFPIWKMEDLIKRYMAHFGIGEPGN